jgi:threonyl-tRNA synthetase
VIPVSDRHAPYADEVRATLRGDGIRCEVDSRSESMGKRIRDGELGKVPFLLIVGDREVETHTASVLARHGDVEGDVPLDGLAHALRSAAPAK